MKTNRQCKKARMTSTSSQSTDSTQPSGQNVSSNSKPAPTSAESCSVRPKGLRPQRGKKQAAADGPAASDGAPRDHKLMPFRGFTREYVEAHRKIVQEAIRRKEIMIRLLKSGSLTDKQLKAILPPCKST